ncbi:unnamed protein product [Phyllotreta striolata]|uniref:Uncharacterized protein n=1 Tax=Phyllotreta striolata TaxID=444603 RepID=A0A9N9TUW9_PHYSR|nr:unnamed protein product [Phyllotreta striolata]
MSTCPIVPGCYCCFKVPFKPVTHVIFDLDGTILDTETMDFKIFRELAKKYGGKLTEEVYGGVLGTNEDIACKKIVNDLNLDVEPEVFQAEYVDMVVQECPTAAFMPGVEQVVKALYKNEVPMAVATSSTQTTIDAKFSQKKEFFDMFHHVVSGNSDPEVLRGKPNPHIHYVACRRFPKRPYRQQCLVFEDSFNGVVAARRAGMQVVMIPTPETSYFKWRYATLRLDCIDHFIPELFGLPPFDPPIVPSGGKGGAGGAGGAPLSC